MLQFKQQACRQEGEKKKLIKKNKQRKQTSQALSFEITACCCQDINQFNKLLAKLSKREKKHSSSLQVIRRTDTNTVQKITKEYLKILYSNELETFKRFY